jgi:hypothetical protein
MKKIFQVLLLLVVFFVAGCGRIQSQRQPSLAAVQIDLIMEPAQPLVGPTQVVVTLADPTGRPISNARLEVEGNMTHAGMTPVFAQAVAGQNGRYILPFEWTMGGDWVVTVKATLPDGQIVIRQFPVTVQP